MIPALLAGLVAACLAIAAEGYVLMGRQQRQANHLDAILHALDRLLPTVPGKSATRDNKPTPHPRTDTAEMGAVLEQQVNRDPAGRHRA